MYYKIKKFSKITGMTERAIRYYEEKGLLIPDRNIENKYRSFSNKNVLEAKQIIFLKSCGLELKEIKYFLDFYRKGEINEEMQNSIITRYFNCLKEFEEKYKQKESLQLLIKDMVQNKRIDIENYNPDGYAFSQVIDGMPDIHKSAYDGDLENVKLSINNIHNVNELNFNGMTPLIFASMAGNKEIVSYLIENGALVDIEDDLGGTALIRAVANGHTEIMKILINSGSNIDYQGYLGETALMVASYKNQIKAVKLLLDLGANRNIHCKKLRDGQLNTAIDFAIINEAIEVEEILRDYPAKK